MPHEIVLFMLNATSIRWKQTLIVTLISGIAVLLFGGAIVARDGVNLRRSLLWEVTVLAQVTAQNSGIALSNEDPVLASDCLAALAEHGNIVTAALFDRNGELVARYDREGSVVSGPSGSLRNAGHVFTNDRLQLVQSVEWEGGRLGTIYLEADLGVLRERAGNQVAFVGGVLAACLVLTFFLANILQRWLWAPVVSLIETAGEDMDRQVERRTEELNRARERADREQARLRLIFDSVPMGIALRTVRPDGTEEVMMNDVQWEICGLRRDQHETSVFFEITHPEDREKQNALHMQVDAREFDRYSMEKRYLCPNGKQVWVYFSVQRQWAADGGYEDLATAVDITALKEAQREADYERDLLRGLLDHSEDYIYFKDLQSRFIKVSTFQARQFGLDSPKEIEGKTDFDFFSETHAREAFDDEQRIIKTGVPILGKVERESWENKEGGFWVLTSKMPWRNKDGEIIGTFGMSRDITEMKEAETKLEQVHQQLLVTSRQAGMAEIATSVLHNVGNVLNTVNVSAGLVGDRLRNSRIASLGKVVALLREHQDDMSSFLTRDPRGQTVPGFLAQLWDHVEAERTTVIGELESVQKNIEHIKEIVAMQQNYARVSGVAETVDLRDLIEDSVRMDGGSMNRHGVELIREFEDLAPITVDRHKVLQVLVNLVRNAKHACQDSDRPDKRIVLRLSNGDGRVRVSVIDNGVGIPEASMTRIFSHGFSTRKDGHGFGLHSSALLATELGGILEVHSEGEGRGASFTLTLPLHPS